MTASDLLDLFRAEMRDLETPYLWSSSLFYSYLNDAQNMFCRLTEGIADASTESITQIVVDENTTWVDTDPLILRFLAATRSDTGAEVEIINREDMSTRRWRFDSRTGPIQALVIGMEPHRARIYPNPNESVTLELRVFRLPFTPICDGGDDLEIDEQHHRHLLMWTKALAYGVQDAETFDKTKKAAFELEFHDYCEAAKREQGRARYKTRAVAYGGI
jgi:hypothetical protein